MHVIIRALCAKYHYVLNNIILFIFIATTVLFMDVLRTVSSCTSCGRPRKLHMSKQNRSGKDFFQLVCENNERICQCVVLYIPMIDRRCALFPAPRNFHTCWKKGIFGMWWKKRKLMTCHHLGRLQSLGNDTLNKYISAPCLCLFRYGRDFDFVGVSMERNQGRKTTDLVLKMMRVKDGEPEQFWWMFSREWTITQIYPSI